MTIEEKQKINNASLQVLEVSSHYAQSERNNKIIRFLNEIDWKREDTPQCREELRQMCMQFKKDFLSSLEASLDALVDSIC